MEITPVIDPVCGMRMDPELTAASTKAGGTRYFFCCKACKSHFDSILANRISRSTNSRVCRHSVE